MFLLAEYRLQHCCLALQHNFEQLYFCAIVMEIPYQVHRIISKEALSILQAPNQLCSPHFQHRSQGEEYCSLYYPPR